MAIRTHHDFVLKKLRKRIISLQKREEKSQQKLKQVLKKMQQLSQIYENKLACKIAC